MSLFGVFKRKAKEPPPTGLVAFMMQNPIWSETDISNLAKAGYEGCMTVFACVGKLAKATGGIPWRLMQRPKSRDARKEEVFTHPLINLIEKPNEKQARSRFIEGITGFYYIAGNAYILGVGPENTNVPKELHWLYPHYVNVKPGNNVEPIAGYKYTANSYDPIIYGSKEVLHIKTFHPTNFWYGLSPIKVAAKGIDTLNMATEWNMKLLQNDMKPPGAIKVEGTLTEPQRNTLNRVLKEEKSGYEHAGLPLVLEGAQEWMPFSINPKDADWLNSQKLTIRFVCLTLGIPPELMGDAENKTYSNQKEARRALYEETILPYMDFLQDEFNNWLTPRFGDRLLLEYDKDSIEALREDRAAIFDRAQKSHFLKINEKRLMTGFDEVPEGDVIVMPISMVPFGGNVGSVSDKGTQKMMHKAKGGSFWTAPERKEALWNNFVIRVKAKEQVFERSAKEYMKEQAGRIEKKLKGAGSLSAIGPESLIDKNDEAEAYQKKFMPWYVEAFTKAGEAGIASTKGELYNLESKPKGWEFEFSAALEELLAQMVFNSGTIVNETLIDIIYRTLQRGLKEGWTVEEFTQMINHQIDEFAPWRARLWARTEAAKVENWGQIEGYRQTEFVEKKGWLSAFAPESRDTHMAADGQVVGLDEAFDIGGEPMQYPGDPAGSPGNVCNCLCDTFPEVMNIEGD